MSDPTPGTQAGREGITIDHRSNHPTETCPSCQDALTTAGYALVPVKEALTVERIAAALFEMHADPTSVEDRRGRPIWEGFGWSRGPSPTDVHPAGMWGPELRKAFAAALLAALKGDSE